MKVLNFDAFLELSPFWARKPWVVEGTRHLVGWSTCPALCTGQTCGCGSCKTLNIWYLSLVLFTVGFGHPSITMESEVFHVHVEPFWENSGVVPAQGTADSGVFLAPQHLSLSASPRHCTAGLWHSVQSLSFWWGGLELLSSPWSAQSDCQVGVVALPSKLRSKDFSVVWGFVPSFSHWKSTSLLGKKCSMLSPRSVQTFVFEPLSKPPRSLTWRKPFNGEIYLFCREFQERPSQNDWDPETGLVG